MAITPKVLGQAIPGAATPADLVTAGGAETITVSTISCCNRNAASTTFKIEVAVAAAVSEAKQALYEDITIAGNDTFAATVGVTLGNSDVIRCESASGFVAFQAFGHVET